MRERKIAKELLHIDGWMGRAEEIVGRGRATYMTEGLLQEAGDSLMMKLGEASRRLSEYDVLPPDGVAWTEAISNRNFLIHRYDEVDREITWSTLSSDLPAMRDSLAPLIAQAQAFIDAENAAAERGE